VYIRLFSGLEQADDVKTVIKILDVADDSSPHLLIILNKMLDNRKNARGACLNKRDLEDIQKGFLDHLKNAFQSHCEASGMNFSSHLVQRHVAKRFQNVKVVFGEIGKGKDEIWEMLNQTNDMAMKSMVYDAQKVASWCTSVLVPRGRESKLAQIKKTMDENEAKIDYRIWCHACAQHEEKLEKLRLERLEASEASMQG